MVSRSRRSSTRDASAHVQLASLAKAGERYDISPRTLRDHIAHGKIAAYRVGRLIKVDLAECDSVYLRRIPTAAD